MDNRAYHLQTHARHAVAAALKQGKLKRQPCEACAAQPAQAHHDSYHTEKWLDVRWLCSAHHRQWHAEHEPEWPSIFDCHPCDEANGMAIGGVASFGRPGRPTWPWFRKGSGSWYVKRQGRQICLGRDQEVAMQKFFALREQWVEEDGAARDTKGR